MIIEGDFMKDNYELKNPPRSNHYAERMKNGYTIIIDRGQDNDEQSREQTVQSAEIKKQRTMQA